MSFRIGLVDRGANPLIDHLNFQAYLQPLGNEEGLEIKLIAVADDFINPACVVGPP